MAPSFWSLHQSVGRCLAKQMALSQFELRVSQLRTASGLCEKRYEMSYIQRELDRIGAVLRDGFNHPNRAELYAAQQALFWAQEPTGFASSLG